MSYPNLISWLNLTFSPGLGSKRLAALWRSRDIHTETLNPQAAGLSTNLCRVVEQALAHDAVPMNAEVEKSLVWAEIEGKEILPLTVEDYPRLLADISDPPPLLYCIGNKDLLHLPQLAMVGTRNPSMPGRETAAEFANALAQSGFVITSGLALGIDGAAHEGALSSGAPDGKRIEANGNTIAVMGSGLNVIYPARHRSLANRIMERGLLISEVSPDTQPKSQNFPRRNRIISGLSLGTLVVEASLKSGSLITARSSLEQGREVFAMPGSIHNPQAKGCHYLIKQGAKLVETVNDILEELPALIQTYQERLQPDYPLQQSFLSDSSNVNALKVEAENSQPKLTPTASERRCETSTLSSAGLNAVAQKILEALAYDSTPPDLLVQRTGLSIHEVTTCLLELELSGLVKEAPGGFRRLE